MFIASLLPLSLHPLPYLIVQKCSIITLLAFTEPHSFIRTTLFPVVLLCNYYLLSIYSLYIPRSAWIGFVAGEILTGPLDYLEKLLLRPWSYEYNGPRKDIIRTRTQNIPGDDGQRTRSGHPAIRKTDFMSSDQTPNAMKNLSCVWKRLEFGTWVAISNRYIASPYEARNTPPYSTANRDYIPSRSSYLLSRGLIFLTCYLITDMLYLGNQPTLNPIIYADEYVSFFPRLLQFEIPIAEIFTRISTTLGFWIGSYFVIQGYYCATGFIAVASGLSSPASRRPTFGSPKDAYSIRRFWGFFWHQLMRNKFTTIANYMTFSFLPLLGLPHKPHTIVPRYTQLVFVFLISGLLHQTIELAQGLPWGESGALKFYLIMAGGIVVEDVIVWGWETGMRPRVKDNSVNTVAETVWWQKAIGYTWTILFFSWATPVWVYPLLRRNTGEIESFPLPFSLVGLFRS